MINKEILEIKKLIKQSTYGTIRLCGCYVVGEERKKLTYINSFLSNLPEEEQHKFVEILKKTLSGSLGKNLFNLRFEREAEDGGEQTSLLALRDSELKNEELTEAFYDKIIEKFDIEGNYLILVMYDTYDVPTKTKDNLEIDEAVETFKFIVSCICPVNLAKPALSYHEETNSIENRTRDWIVDMPCAGFMFPAFNDRSADIHSLLYYARSAKEMYPDFIEGFLGCEEVMPAENQKQLFNEIIESVVVNQPDVEVVDVVRNVNENISEVIENNTSDEPVTYGKEDIKHLLSQSGVKEELLDRVDDKFERELGEDMRFAVDDIMEKRKFEIKTNDVTLNVKPEHSSIVKIKMIDGRKCLVIPMDDNVEINGIMSKIKEELENME